MAGDQANLDDVDIQGSQLKFLDEEGDLPSNFEPGATRNSIFYSADLTVDQENIVETEYDPNAGETRSRSRGTISEIERSSVSEGDEQVNVETEQECVSNNVIEDIAEAELEPYVYDDEEVNSQEWRQQKKHIFILSEAGKPIYSRHGSEDNLVTLMGVMQALVACIQDSEDVIKFIRAGNHKFVFLLKLPLILAAVTTNQMSFLQLQTQLTYIHNQILSVLTAPQLSKIFEQRKNYDLRRLIAGSERFLDSLTDLMDKDPSFLLGAVRCLPLSSQVRDTISQSIVQHCGKIKNVVFAILLANNQLVTLVRMKKYQLHPVDLHLIINLVHASESFKSAESWTPICLPKFDSSGFLHGHVSYLEDDCPACLLLLTVDRDLFFSLQECRRKIVERLRKYNCLEAINQCVKSNGYSVQEVGIFELRHFLYKSKSAAQLTSPHMEAPYLQASDQERLMGLYHYLQQRMYNPGKSLKILYFAGEKETMLGWHMVGFELYASFEPLITKDAAVRAMTKLVHWIKKEEDRLFIMNAAAVVF